MPEYSIGVDLGGTNLRAAAISRDGKILSKIAGRAQFTQGREAVISDIVTSINSLRAELGATGFVGVGIGVAGFILIKEGKIVGAHNLLEFDNFAMRDDVEQRLGAPVILENDANAAALGEKWMGAGQDVDDMLLLTLGTGVGGGIISGGKVLHGHVGMAGELGHMTVVPNGNPCGCGNRGCLEKHASATAVVAMAKLLHLGENVTAKDVHDLASMGNEKAQMVLAAMGEALGTALATLINIFNFPLYVLSGGPLPAWNYFAPSMIAEVTRRSFTYRNTDTRIVPAILGNEAGLIGAAYLPFQAVAAKG